MTTIQKIKFHGFKSFAKPIEIEFGNNFNCIIGPNGSGKSNIVDGLTFVLGKRSAKAMRAEKASNLIFNGGKKGSPMKEASVSIYFTNNSKEFPIASEVVKITRLVKQSGQSDYRINDEKRTREQIIDLLSKAGIDSDGFNILLQGDVVSFTEMRSDERRQIIEDVAGISVYEDKKQKALLELEKVDQKINEANLILKERDAHLRNLKKERDQALKFKELEQNIKENKATYLYLQIKEKNEKKEEIVSRIKKHQQNIDSLNKEVQELRTKTDQKRSEVDSINKNIEEKSEIEQVSLQQNIEKIREEILRDETRLENLKIEIQKVNQRSSQLKKDELEIETKIKELNKEKIALEEKQKTLKKEEEAVRKNIQNYKKRHNIQDFSLMEKIESEIEQLQNSIISLKEQKSSLIIEQDRNNQEINKVKELLDKFSSPQVKKKREELEKVERELDSLINNLNVTITQIDSNKEKLEQFKQELSSLRGKKISIADSLSGNQSVNLILNSRINGV
ncbi:MAG: AAA family ATPase, partial [Nanoarchaeota archaeon]